jgi:membrane associated rhomboid family serine protease
MGRSPLVLQLAYVAMGVFLVLDLFGPNGGTWRTVTAVAGYVFGVLAVVVFARFAIRRRRGASASEAWDR